MANTFSVPRSICVLTESVAYLFLLLALFASQLKAQTNSSWNGGTGNWSHTSDWSPSGVPNNSGSTTFRVKIVAPDSAVSMDVLNATIDNLTLAAANSLTINAGNTLTLFSGTSANYGTISNNGGFTLINNFSNGPTLNNYGTISGTGGLVNAPAGTFNNYGTVSTGNFISFGLANNYGTLSVSGQSQNQGTLTDYGTLSVAGILNGFSGGAEIIVTATGVLNNTGRFQNDSYLAIAGTIYNAPGASLINTDSISSTIVNTGTIINAGTILNTNLAIFQGGTVDNLSGGSLINEGPSPLSVSTLNNAGTVTNDGRYYPLALFSVGTLTNSGTITNEGDGARFSAGILFNGGMVRNTVGATLIGNTFINTGMVNNQGTLDSGSFTNLGRVKISDAGLFNISTNYNQFAGSTLVNGTLTANGNAIVNILGGSLSGGGTINGNVLMAGDMIAGTPSNPMTFNINGNYTQNATGIFTEMISSKANGLLNISGTAALSPGASLNVQLVGGFDPKNGTSFTIMDYGSEKGAFTISDPSFNDGTQKWVITSYNGGDGDDVVLTAETAPVATPEPGTMLLLGSGLVALGGYAKKKRTSGTRQIDEDSMLRAGGPGSGWEA
jgi:PEP-CTERM motif